VRLLKRFVVWRPAQPGGPSGKRPAEEVADRLEDLAREQARLGREQSRAITLLEGHSAALDELAATWEEQVRRRRCASSRADRTLGALEEGFAQRMVQELLPVADALKNTVEAAQRLRDGEAGTTGLPTGETLAAWTRGALLVEQRLLAVLERLGAERIPTIGRRFDPTLHRAVAVVDEEAKDGTILAEELAGYTLRDRVLRHAEVIVARSGSPGSAEALEDIHPDREGTDA
jgi:molecular chaperone GrpE